MSFRKIKEARLQEMDGEIRDPVKWEEQKRRHDFIINRQAFVGHLNFLFHSHFSSCSLFFLPLSSYLTSLSYLYHDLTLFLPSIIRRNLCFPESAPPSDEWKSFLSHDRSLTGILWCNGTNFEVKIHGIFSSLNNVRSLFLTLYNYCIFDR